MTAIDILDVKKTAALGFGAMRLPDEDKTCKMVDAYMDSGYNYFDTAYIYGGSEEMLKKTLVKRYPRESFLVADKLPPWEVKQPGDREKLFKESLRRTGLDYFDFYLVHSLSDAREQDVENLELFQYVAGLKKQGLVKHIGFSFHGSTAYLERLLKNHPESEFVQLQLNYTDILRGPAGEWHDLALKYNKPIIVMEPIKGGSLANLPQSAEALLKGYAPELSIASWAIRYAATLEGVTCVLSGMTTPEEIRDNLSTFKNLKPLTSKEMDLINQTLDEISKVAGIPCTACKYCHSSCPMDISIATCFSLYNEYKRGSELWNRAALYRTLPEGQRAIDCTTCGACMTHCPQNIDIPKGLKEVAEAFK